MKLIYANLYDGIPHPQPTKEVLPEWVPQNTPERSFYNPLAFFDAMSLGYTFPLWNELIIESLPNCPFAVGWKDGSKPPIKHRGVEKLKPLPVPVGHHPDTFTLLNPYLIKTEPGYGTIITHPINRFDLPFTIVTCYLDTDINESYHEIPVFFKENYQGSIPLGTPLFTAIPYKKENIETVQYSSKVIEVEGLRGLDKRYVVDTPLMKEN